MNITTKIETIGTITKKEVLTTVGYDELILESLHPYPGYHGTTVPDKTNPKSVFLVTKTNHSDEEIIRATIAIKQKMPLKFDASPGQIEVFNTTEGCIRIKDLEDYQAIPDLCNAFKDEGISLQKGKKIEPYTGIIKIIKYFILDELNNGIYMDRETPAMGYFEIPVKLEWDVFEKITLDIKRNVEDNNFDAALGILYRKSGLKDVVRIYDTNVCLGECLYLREKFYEEINKHVQNK